jgi:predicted metallopeptidase
VQIGVIRVQKMPKISLIQRIKIVGHELLEFSRINLTRRLVQIGVIRVQKMPQISLIQRIKIICHELLEFPELITRNDLCKFV